MVDERLHALFHHSAGWRHKLVVVDLHSTRGNLVERLADDPQALSHLLDTAQVAVIAVTVLAYRNVELNLSNLF